MPDLAYEAPSLLPEILINGRFLGQRVTGVQRYARETLLCMDELLSRGEGDYARWTLLLPPGTAVPSLCRIETEVVGRSSGHLWEQVDLPWRARKGLLVGFGLTGPITHRQQIITIHDANVIRFPEAFSLPFRIWYRLLVPRLIARAPLTIAVSRFSAREAEQCYGASRHALRIATEGWQHLERIEADDAILDRHQLRGVPFAFAVGSLSANKNFAVIARALAILGPVAPRCVVAGDTKATIFQRAGALPRSIHRVGYVSDAELKALYQNATCFIFPSFYEGFGIPPLEAMACGCAVIASTAPALREVCADAALYFDPRDPKELASKLYEVFASSELRTRMVTAGLERAGLYSWMENARLNLGYIHEHMKATHHSQLSGLSCHA
ncbi:MAG: glycosyltransferase family 1 protein [Pseudomonadota bacterium]